jgi:polysaccharide transporter, PST family
MINDDAPPETTLAHAARGYRTTLLAQAVRVGCKAASVVILARLVSPAEHGLFAMAASVFFILVLFRDLGVGPAVVRAASLTDEQCSTLWRVHAGTGVGLAALAAGLAPWAARFFHEPRVTALLALMSLALVLIGLGGWPRLLLMRELRFPELNRVDTIAAVLGTLAMIGAAWLGAGAYAFAVFLIASEAIALLGTWRACRWRPSARARWGSLRELWRPGADLTGYNIATTVLQQIDSVFMGRWFGSLPLGLYNRPVQLLALPMQHIAAPTAQVLLSTLARLGPAAPAFAPHVRATANLIAHLTLPLAVACAILPHEIVRLLLGAEWPGAAPLLRWLALGGAASYLGATVPALCIATSHTRRLVAMASITLVATVAALHLGRGRGPEGIAAAVALANFALLPLRLAWACRGTGVRLRDYGAAFLGPLALSAAGATGLLAGRAAAADSSWPIRLACALAAGTLAAALLSAVWPRLRHELRQITQRPVLTGGRGPAAHAEAL